jgi:hypothetical protein
MKITLPPILLHIQETRTHRKDDSRDPRRLLLLRANSRKGMKRR